MLEEPPSQENTKLRLEFPDDVVKKLDGNDPGIKSVSYTHLDVYKRQHPARAALGTRAAGITAAEELVAREQFGGCLLYTSPDTVSHTFRFRFDLLPFMLLFGDFGCRRRKFQLYLAVKGGKFRCV